MRRLPLLLSTAAALALGACSDSSDISESPRLAVFIQTNDAAGNAVVGYGRGEGGMLTERRTYPTGGRGTGIPRLGPQGSVLLREDGSHEISIFGVGDDTVLTAALQIHSVEARHASQIRRLRGQKGWITNNERGDLPPESQATYDGEEAINGGVTSPAATEAFDEPLTMEQVLAIAAPFNT